ncbi:MAG: hypothetical protein FJ340_04165 [Sphingomonadales bacterium]|nr:hypothetical protein [Sphingomonadales bacterium]
MKNYLFSALLTICVLSSCFSQQLVKKQADARLIIEQKDRFINKQLKDLLKEIKPEIKYAFGTDSGDHGVPAFFNFMFVTREQSDSLRAKNLSPIVIFVYVKENIDWFGRTKRTKETGHTWTEDDFRNYKDFTVIDLWIPDN